ncbi:hypothetical protein ASPBRDRAFT_125488 [Aspergillus brasiliensis CBS 101740]|uniref:Uncharacterized protein n=1 Tax=Aspergillus brasiliensis (strain CBS 101740 / IMI 381727 / IBT 21946) TaxID=767769 RepID=A0A1L9UJG8_ASPBC|nr:hypothetical protein ASPBRDRAFT_125488 [Aspergillus brasiliensis CBS 101740]
MVLCIVGGRREARLQQVLKLAFLGSETDPLSSFCVTRRTYRTGRWDIFTARSVSSCTWTCQLHAGICHTAAGDFLGSFPFFVARFYSHRSPYAAYQGHIAKAGNTSLTSCRATSIMQSMTESHHLTTRSVAKPKKAIPTKQRVPYYQTTPDPAFT